MKSYPSTTLYKAGPLQMLMHLVCMRHRATPDTKQARRGMKVERRRFLRSCLVSRWVIVRLLLVLE